MGISSLNAYAHISAQKKTDVQFEKVGDGGHFKGQIYKSLFQRQNYSQIQSTTENVQ